VSPISFTHLHVASSYSLRYGVASPAALVARAAELGMPALALTDRDGLYGAFRHAQACTDAGLKPILGTDLALRDAPGQVEPETGSGAALAWARQATRVTLLAQGRQGWASICRLVTAAHAGATGHSDTDPRSVAKAHGVTPVHAEADAGARTSADVSPAVTPSLIAQHAVGLILLLGPASDVGQAVAARRPDLARSALDRWRDLGVEVAVEVVDHLDAPGSTHRAARMAQLAQQAHVPAVLANAVRPGPRRRQAPGPAWLAEDQQPGAQRPRLPRQPRLHVGCR